VTDTTAPVTDAADATSESVPRRGRWLRWGLLAVWGPGLVVMLADTDAGSLITASQSGAQWGYRMVLPQLILMPILYVVQEMTVRLGIVTRKGHGALIRERFGRFWAWISAFTLFASAIGALLTEFAGVAGVGELFGVSRWVSIPVATAALLALALTGSYRRVERIGLAIGAAELAFLVAMVMARPEPKALVEGLKSMPLGNSSYLLLVAANVGAVIMPWMIFYQQGAVVDKHLSVATIRQARHDTAAGAALTQLIMIAVVVTMASTLGSHNGEAALETVGQIAGALTPYLGHVGGTVLFGLGMLGAALVAAIVSSLAGAGTFGGLRVAAHPQPAAQPGHRQVLHHLCARPSDRRRARAGQRRPGPPGRRRRGDERLAATHRAGPAAGAGSPSAARAVAHARTPQIRRPRPVSRCHGLRAVHGSAGPRLGVNAPATR
jgi:Mn2+/Fe2+ NRAMP family transporter